MESKILLISHNVFDYRSNMGKTLAGFFLGWNPQCLAQLYLHSEVPTTEICHRYFRITDIDALKSLLPGKRNHVGRTFSEKDFDTERASSRVDAGILHKIYSFGRKRSSLIYAARNMMWRLSGWYSNALRQWISEFAPDVIFFAAGDYAFAYDIAYKISKEFDIPIVMYCCDDYFLNRRNPDSLLSLPVYKSFMRSVHRCFSRTAVMITICDKMTEAYKALFDKPIYTVYTGCIAKGQLDVDGEGIVYLGNLGYSRNKALVEIGQALKRISKRTGQQLHLDVYSAENSPEILKDLTEENGILFHGAVDSDVVRKIIAASRLAVHVESFAPENRRKVMYSVSTKIADLLASGRCIFAYGPEEVASLEYLKKHHAACVVTKSEELEKKLEDILNSRESRMATVESAMKLAEKNHDSSMVQRRIKEVLRDVCKGKKNIVSN